MLFYAHRTAVVDAAKTLRRIINYGSYILPTQLCLNKSNLRVNVSADQCLPGFKSQFPRSADRENPRTHGHDPHFSANEQTQQGPAASERSGKKLGALKLALPHPRAAGNFSSHVYRYIRHNDPSHTEREGERVSGFFCSSKKPFEARSSLESVYLLCS